MEAEIKTGTPKLNEALAKAQGEIKDADLDKFNPHFKSQYSSYAALWAACRGPLTKNGLSVSYSTELLTTGAWALRTTLLHSSGEERSFLKPLFMMKQDMQQLGAAETYGKKYALQGFTGIASHDLDDDGNSISADDTKPIAKSQETTVENFVIPFGKFKGKRIVDIDPFELTSYCDFMAASIEADKSQGKKPHPNGIKVFEMIDKWLSGTENKGPNLNA